MGYDVRVHIPAWLPLSSLHLYPESQIGFWAKTVGKLHQAQIPLDPGLVIPCDTFLQIAEDNHLDLADIQKLGNSQAVADFFSGLKIPRPLAQELLKVLGTVIGNNFCNVRSSFTELFVTPVDSQEMYIQGDTNILESALRLWGKACWQSQKLAAAAMVITQQRIPLSSGWSFSQDIQTQNKTQVSILATPGALLPQARDQVFDHFKVDVRTWNVLQSVIAHKEIAYEITATEIIKKSVPSSKQNHPSLTSDQAISLAKLTTQVKRLFIHHCQLAWYSSSQGLFITDVDEDLTPSASEKPARAQTTLCLGTPIIPGVVEGLILHGPPIGSPQSLPHKTILVVRQLTPQLTAFFPHLAGLILEKPLPTFGLRLLSNYHLPTIANVPQALAQLKSGQPIILDGTNGRVYSQLQPVVTEKLTGPTLTKVFITASNPSQSQDELTPSVDGVFFKSEYFWVQGGIHPAHVARSSDRSEYIQSLTAAISAFKPRQTSPLLYKTLDLSSDDLLSLHYSGIYEQPEPNPFLGFRGALRTVSNFEILDMELEALMGLSQTAHQSLGIVLPLTRIPSEARLLMSHIKRTAMPVLPRLELWWQLCTPENLLQVEQYLSPQLTGIVVNVNHVHALLYGIDPRSPDLLNRYPLNFPLLRKWLDHLVSASPHHKLMLQIDAESQDLIYWASELGLAGVIVKPYHADRTKRLFLEAERQKLPTL